MIRLVKAHEKGSPSSIFAIAMAMADAGQCVARLQSMEPRDETWENPLENHRKMVKTMGKP